ncbi:hypothetical protein B5M09_004605 [Aphanomyces astaci]|uniref:non-specific serine/threonine protein kinase n=1 Tax=Aphanomyces astaci TaxID=112090 RepID=A0A3R7Y235_APHAT|nr:hypothetical protein B5M09_004605 [Aphanomyces astaci]
MFARSCGVVRRTAASSLMLRLNSTKANVHPPVGDSSGGSKLWLKYKKYLEAYPLTTKCLTSAGIAGTGDVLCQVAFESKPFDVRRFATFTALGGVFIAPTLHVWYGFLNRVVAGTAATAVATRLVLDQFVFAPSFLASFFGVLLVVSPNPGMIVYATDFAGRPCVIKERVVKTYRLRQLDKKLSHRRLVQEARCNFKCRKAGVDTPCIFLIDEAKGRLYMERIQGMSAKQYLYDSYNATTQQYATDALAVCYQIGVAIARMHDADIVHGDLTTSNLMKKDSLSTITVIDFGLANSQPLPEDKAVDLYVMERAFQSTHVHSEPLVHSMYKDDVVLSDKKQTKNDEAQRILERIAEHVLPICTKRRFKVRNLLEFFPKNANLLGMNVNEGWKIFLRLRPASHPTTFLPFEEILGTMLHELVHMKIGPHDASFYKMLDELTEDMENLMARGLLGATGAAFQDTGDGQARMSLLFLHHILSIHQAIMSTNRLGGASISPSQLRGKVLEAAEKRLRDAVACATVTCTHDVPSSSQTHAPNHIKPIVCIQEEYDEQDAIQWQCPTCSEWHSTSRLHICDSVLRKRKRPPSQHVTIDLT